MTSSRGYQDYLQFVGQDPDISARANQSYLTYATPVKDPASVRTSQEYISLLRLVAPAPPVMPQREVYQNRVEFLSKEISNATVYGSEVEFLTGDGISLPDRAVYTDSVDFVAQDPYVTADVSQTVVEVLKNITAYLRVRGEGDDRWTYVPRGDKSLNQPFINIYIGGAWQRVPVYVWHPQSQTWFRSV